MTGMKKYLACSLFLLAALPLIGQAACTEDELDFKKEKALHFRIYALQGAGKLSVYSQIASELGREFSTLYTLYRQDKAAGQAGLNRLCAVMDQMIAVADDLLAGGNGLEKQTPWLTHSPEDFLKASATLAAYCTASSACETGEGMAIREELEQIDQTLAEENDSPAGRIDAYYERITQFLKAEKQPDSQKTE